MAQRMERVQPVSQGQQTKVSAAQVEIAKEKREQKKKQLDTRLQDLYSRYENSVQTMGLEHQNTIMLGQLLEMVCQIKLFNEQIESMAFVFETISGSIELMDTTMGSLSGIMEVMSNPGPRSQAQAAKLAKTFSKNIKAKFKELEVTMGVMPKVTGIMTKALSGISKGMVKGKGKGSAGAGAGGFSAETASVLGSMGLDTKSSGSGASAPSAPPPSAPAGPSGSVLDDDIFM